MKSEKEGIKLDFENICYKKDNTYYITDNAYVFLAEFSQDSEFPTHKHNFVELVYMLKGKGVQIIDGREYPVKRGDLVMVNYNQDHAFKILSAGAYVNILMKTEYISRNLKNRENAFALLNLLEFEEFEKILDKAKRKVTFSADEREYIETLIYQLMSEMNNEDPGYSLATKSIFNLILITVFRKMSLEMEIGFNGISESLLSFLSQNCDKKLTLEQVADMCNYNPSYFSRIFKRITGLTFTAYLKKERIKKAEYLLKETDVKITDIPWRIGYSDATAFFSDFKKQLGQTPKQYRKVKNK